MRLILDHDDAVNALDTGLAALVRAAASA